jgi:acyl-CoA thioesterase YciA
MELISTKVCKTSDIGINDNLFGGVMLSWLDESGFLLATDKACNKNMVTLKIEEVLFKLPVKVNDHIKIYGEVANIGNSSMTIKLEAKVKNFMYLVFKDSKDEDLLPRAFEKEILVCSTTAVFVQIGIDGHSLKFTKEQLENMKL